MNHDSYVRSLREALERVERIEIQIDGFQRAAVLVPLLVLRTGVELLLTQRTEGVETHKGQVSFPGGAVEEGDRDPIHTALREAEEELGLSAAAVTTVGLLDDHATPTGFVITPVVGVVRGFPVLRPNPHEVAEVLRVPLHFFAETQRVRREQREFRGRTHDVWFYDTGTQVIWGATAAMVRSLLSRLGMLREEARTMP
jgi:8-oxo-dGTP pyrophosphatase MutT (NUDIX family)